jgi:competence protein ComEC
MEQQRGMQLPLQALAFAAGVLWVATRATLQTPGIALALLAAVALLACRCPRRLVIAFVVAVLWTWLRAWSGQPETLAPHVPGIDLTLTGDVVSLPEAQAGRVQFDFAPREGRVAGLPSRLRLSWFDAPRAPCAAETWQLVVRLRAPRGFSNPGGYDYEGELFRAGVGATGYVRASALNRRLELRVEAYPVLALRAAIVRRIEEALPNSPAMGVLSGLAVGASQRISAEQWRVFAATGTTHLIAISGLHVTMVAALAMLLAQAAWRLPRRQAPRGACADVSCLCGAVAALAYAVLAGFSVPTQRTVVMLLCALSAIWLRRAQPPANVLSLALIAVLLYDPHAALTAGLWLSFVAVAAIILGTGLLERSHPLRAFLATQAAVSVALVPATALLFGSVSMVAPAANLLAIPLFSALLVPGTLLAVALMPCRWLSDLTLGGTANAFELAWPVLQWAASLPGALVHLATPGVWQAVLLCASALVLMAPVPLRLRTAGLLLFVALVAFHPARPAAGAFTLTTLDVGQGLSVVVRTRMHVLLFDAGPAFRSGRSAGELVVVPYLRHEGIAQLDMLVTSHADNDHAGGAAAVEQAFTVLTARHGGDKRRDARIPSSPCQRGEAWIWDGVTFEFLHPGAKETWSDNDSSCVLAITAGRTRALLTGDIERAAEERLLTHADFTQADIIVVPHHGSRSSSTEAFVTRASAKFAIVSAGAANRWHFPHDVVVARWCAAGTRVLGSAEWGAITIAVDSARGVTGVRSHRLERRRYWHAFSAQAGQPRCRDTGTGQALFMRPGRCSMIRRSFRTYIIDACGKSSKPAGPSCGPSSCARSARPRSSWNACGRCNASACCRASSPSKCGSG